MKYSVKKYLICLSVGMNLFVALPALVLLVGSSAIQYDIYQNILAPRFGKPKIIFIGDSIIRGGNIWAFRIGRYNLNVWNYGQIGFTTYQIQDIARKAAEHDGVQYAFVMAGINDPDKTVAGAERTFDDYKVIIDTLSKAGIEPIIQLTLYRENEKSTAFIDRLNDRLAAYAKENNLRTIDLNPILAPKKSLLPEYSRDGVHLAEAAYNIWSKKIRELLEVMDSEQVAGESDMKR